MARKHSMASADAAWLRMDGPTNQMVVNSVLWFEEPVSRARLKRVFQQRIVDQFPRFRQRAVTPTGRAPYWEDDPHFDIDRHIHRLALPAPGSTKALQELVSDLMSAPLDHAVPLWQAYLVEGYGPGSAVVVRIHHAVADGIALARVMLLIADSTRAGKRLLAAPGDQPHHSRAWHAAAAARGVASRLAHEGFESLQHPRHLAEIGAGLEHELVGDAKALAKLLGTGADAPTPLRAPVSPANRVAWSTGTSLAGVKATSRALDATINDVLMTAVAGALGRYLRERRVNAPEVRAMVPFNLRPLDEPLDRGLGNHFALILLGLPTSVRDPVKRLRAVKREMDSIKGSREPAVSFGILALMGLTPAQVEERLVTMFSAKASLVLTNVPGPRDRLYVAGVPLAGVLSWAPCSGTVGTSVTIFSYAGEVIVGFMTDAELIPDPDRLARLFREELRELSRAARTAARPQAHSYSASISPR